MYYEMMYNLVINRDYKKVEVERVSNLSSR